VRQQATVGPVLFNDSAFVTVLPNHRLALASIWPVIGGLSMAYPDGSDARQLLSGFAGYVRWAPTGQALIVAGAFDGWIASVDLSGSRRDFGNGSCPTFSHDGQWIYFSRYVSPADRIHRVRSDGSGLELFAALTDRTKCVTFSPGDTAVAYRDWDGRLRVLSLTTGVVRTILAAIASWSSWVSWSPDGQWLAFDTPSGGPIHIIRPDGTGERTLPLGVQNHSWSPDSKWLTGSDFSERLSMVSIETGEIIRIPGSIHALWVDWARQ
jgi:Tol biopolymer transport system component